MEQSFQGNGSNSSEQRILERHKLELDPRNLKFFKEDIFRLPFKELEDSSNYRHLKHVFVDEEDYEDFRQDLVDFHCMRTRWKVDRRKVSRDRGKLSLGGDEQFSKSAVNDSNYNVGDSPVSLSPKVDIKHVNSPSLDVPKSWLDFELEPMPIMEFFQNDEHFQEFDRVFETFKTKKRYASNSSLDKYRWSPHPESDQNGHDDSDINESGDPVDDDVFGIKINDIFADFFDNDDSFINFEEEFEKFQFKRHSRALNSLHRNSVCDLIEDLKAFCDTEETKSSKTGSDLQVESKLSLPKLWNQGGEWDFIFSKIRQHGSKLTSETSETGKSDLTVRYDSDSGDCLLDDLSECSESNRDTGYYSEAKFDAESCTCPCTSKHTDCQFTCHHNCLPLIQLECKSMSHDQGEDLGAVFSREVSLSDLNAKLSPSSELSSEPATEKDETDSGYRSGTIPDEKLPHKPSDATLNKEELKRRIAEFNRAMPGANFALKEDDTNKDAFQGFIKVTLNLVRPITMSLGARPPSIYEVLTREHIIEQNTQNMSFYMPRDTIRSIHATSTQNTKEVLASLLKKFHILDHPHKFALYEQELKNNKIAKLRRVKDHEIPLSVCLAWDIESEGKHRLVLQENETGEIEWEAFCTPELNNFMKVLNREEDECMGQLKYKYKVMKRLIQQRMKELRQEADRQNRASMAQELVS